MTPRRKIKSGIVILLIGIISWQFGLLNRYNYLTAKIDIMREKPCLVEVGDVLSHFGIAENGLNQKYGFEQSTSGSFLSVTQLRGIESYNKEIEKFLIKRNGNNWRKKYKTELDSIIKIELNK
jgi:hypothetical protein